MKLIKSISKIDKNLIIPKEMTSELAEEMGLHFGDGSMNCYKGKGFYQLRGHLTDDKDHYLTRIKPLYKQLFNLDVSLRDMPSTGVFGFQIWSDRLVVYKNKTLHLPMGKKTDFVVPLSIIGNDIFSRSFLRGFFDTDGCLYIENKRGKPYPRIELGCTCKGFVKQLKDMIIRMGFRTSYYSENRAKYGWETLHRISIKGNIMTKKWFKEIQPKNPKHLKKFDKLNLL